MVATTVVVICNVHLLASDLVTKQGVSHTTNMTGLIADQFDKLVYLLNTAELYSNSNEGSTKMTLSKPFVTQIMPLQQRKNPRLTFWILDSGTSHHIICS